MVRKIKIFISEKEIILIKVGCGAIGCELLKLFALLGVGRSGEVCFFEEKQKIFFKNYVLDYNHRS
jgi:hypothetical protein